MTRRNQSRRRRAYGRRQHELRQRRTDQPVGSGEWLDQDGAADHDAQLGGLTELYDVERFERRGRGAAA